jgi:hypothetical protein
VSRTERDQEFEKEDGIVSRGLLSLADWATCCARLCNLQLCAPARLSSRASSSWLVISSELKAEFRSLRNVNEPS